MKTFREMAANYIKWAQSNKLRDTPGSKAYWERQERIIYEQLAPFVVGLTEEKHYRSIIDSLKRTIEANKGNDDNYKERQRALDAFVAVYCHYEKHG